MTSDEQVAVGADSRHEPPAWMLLGGYTILALALTFPNVTRLRTFVVGDSGDSLLTLWIVRHVQEALPHGWDALWNAPIFHPAPDTFAYSDPLLPVGLLHWPLRLVFGDVLAFNLIALGAWVLCCWCTYRLALRMCRSWPAAAVAALMLTYSAARISHRGHFQLVVGGALVPLVVLLLLRCLDAPSARRGLALGFTFACLTLTASYYGAMMAVFVVVLVGGRLLFARPEFLRPHVIALGTAGVVVVALVLPIAWQYAELQRDPAFRRSFEPGMAAHAGDFIATTQDSYLLEHLPQIGARSEAERRGIENRLFPGFVTIAFGVVGIVVVACELRGGGWRRGRTLDMVLLTIAGLACVVLAFGDNVTIGGREIPLPFTGFRHLVPGFAGMRATARLAIGAQLVLALFAAIGMARAFRSWTRTTQVAAAGALGLVVVAEVASSFFTVRVPTDADDGGVSEALEARPAGPVLELPINSGTDGVAWPYVETPRQYRALDDGRPRVNGYSGFQPKRFDEQAETLNEFPAPAALAEARRHGVRYVVLRTALVGDVSPAIWGPILDVDGVGRYDDATAREMLEQLPAGDVAAVEPVDGGYVIELAPPR
jgi:hypothetical protein